ncbi:unnamed protein product [Discula destructiva]
MAATQTVLVPQLGGITAGYVLRGANGGGFDPSKPTFVMINGMYMCSSIFSQQFDDARLAAAANLLAIEPPGTGATWCMTTEHWTYWDAAAMALQVMERLGVEKAYALGSSAGGFIVTRMALLAPERVQGIVMLGTSMDYESSASRAKGCWDAKSLLSIVLDLWTNEDSEFVMDGEGRKIISSMGFHPFNNPEQIARWCCHLDDVYSGEAGRKRAKMCLLNILTRDGLLMRLEDVKCPVHWLQGSLDKMFGTSMPAEHIKLFTSAPQAILTCVPGGGHYLNATNPKEVNDAMVRMLTTENR